MRRFTKYFCAVTCLVGWAIPNLLFAQSLVPTSPATPYTLDLSLFATHGGIGPIDIGSPNDGSGNVFVATNSGQIFGYGQNGNSIGTLLDINDFSQSGFAGPGNNEGAAFRGLGYFDFHPDYAVTGSDGFRKLYVNYRASTNSAANSYDFDDFTGANTNGRSFVISEFSVSPGTNTVDPSSFREVFRVQTQGGNAHGIGEIAFNPLSNVGDADYGLLYGAVGDANSRGNANPLPGYVQNLNNPFGTIIRIDPLAQSNGSPYGLPADNPFNNGGATLDNDGRAEEIYAFGFRDPQTFSFAPDSNGNTVLVTADIGADQREEINLVRSGGNYGWDRFEGNVDLNPDRPLVAGTVHSPPVLEYEHGDFEATGRAIIGGVVVSDPNDPEFQNQVLFGDLVNGNLFHADYDDVLAAEANGMIAETFLLNASFGGNVGDFGDVFDGIAGGRSDTRFGFNGAGELFLVSRARSTSSGGQALGSDRIFSTGLFRSFSAVPEPGMGGLLIAGLGLMVTRRMKQGNILVR